MSVRVMSGRRRQYSDDNMAPNNNPPNPASFNPPGAEGDAGREGEQVSEKVRSEFLRCYTLDRHRIFNFILTLLPNTADAEEVFQETSIVLWDKFDTFRPGTNFVSWGCAIAQRVTFKHRRDRNKAPLLLSESMLQGIAKVRLEKSDLLERRRQALGACLQKLSEKDRQLVQQRYLGKMNSRQLAQEIDRPENTVYKALSRIRQQLMECVNRTLHLEEQS